MIRYYKLKRYPEWYFKIEGKNAWCARRPSGAFRGDPVPVDILIKDYKLIELIELTEEEVFLEFL